MSQTTDLITRYWTTCDARDWAAFGELLSADVVYEIPQTRERIRGRENYLEFNRGYPGDWRVRLVRVVGDGRHGASWTDFQIGDDSVPALCFFDLDEDGLISHITDFWPEPYTPPTGREHLTERY
jgi:hypothetical protein